MTAAGKKQRMLRVLAEALGQLRLLAAADVNIETRREIAAFLILVDEALDRLLDAHTPADILLTLQRIGDTLGKLTTDGERVRAQPLRYLVQ